MSAGISVQNVTELKLMSADVAPSTETFDPTEAPE